MPPSSLNPIMIQDDYDDDESVQSSDNEEKKSKV